MSANDVQIKILEPMQRVYLPPRRMEPGDELAALRDYVEALEQFTGSDLSEAWRRVRETHTTRSWPLPSAFFKFASESRKDRNEAIGGKRRQGPDPKELWERWKAVSRSPMAREAVKRGVSWTLKCAVLHDGKKPEEIDLREFTSAKHRAAQTFESIKAEEALPFKDKLLRPMNARDRETALTMYGHIQANETRTAQEINYGVAETQEAAE